MLGLANMSGTWDLGLHVSQSVASAICQYDTIQHKVENYLQYDIKHSTLGCLSI